MTTVSSVTLPRFGGRNGWGDMATTAAFEPTPEWYCLRRNWPTYAHPRSRPLPAHSLYAP
jgi:hypothetical protein